MPFDKSVSELLNELVVVAPIPGYGWQRTNEDGSLSHDGEFAIPSPFRLRILEFFSIDGIPTVACGRIESAEHALNGWWATLIPITDDVSANLTNEATN